ncbi:MAG: hypothetical protein C0520_08470 [Sphingopyxis sp.]|nr:hypothetical protein [Sphingopyxis sp.]
MIGKKLLAAAMMSAALGGCYSFQGPERLVTKDLRPAVLQHSNTDMFKADFTKAHAFRQSDPTADNVHVYPMLRSGFMYNYSFCENYFTQMVQNQRRSQIARDIIPPITALITGIIGLGDFSSHPGRKEDYIQMLALGTAATSATLNIYDRHFLFGAENVGAVQTMALKAQSVHAQSVLKQKNLSFEMAMQHLIDNQGQCSPQSILSLARSVIKDTKLVGTDGAPAAAGAGGVPAPPPSEGKITVVPAI